MKKLLIFTITAAMLLSLTACAQSAKPDVSLDTPAQEQTVSGSTQIPNPWESYDTADAAANAAGFTLTEPRFESEAHEKAWLLRVAGNLSKNRLSYNAVRAADELNDELVAENREDLSFVWQAVRNLPETYREAIHLFYHEGCSTRQIAQILQRSEATVRSDLHRGRQLLREILKEAYDFDEV